MKKIFTILTLVLLFASNSQAQHFLWAKQYAKTQPYNGILQSGNNLYLTGYGTLLTKTDMNGSVIWTKAVSNNFNGFSVKADGNGNLLVAGSFYSNPTVHTSSGDVTLSSASGDVFVAKMDTSGGVTWIKQSKAFNGAIYSAFDADNNGNCYLAAKFTGQVNMNTTTLISRGDFDNFVVRYNADGTMAWVTQMGGSGTDGLSGMALDQFGKLRVTGTYIADSKFGTYSAPTNTGLTGYMASMNVGSGAFEKVAINLGMVYDNLRMINGGDMAASVRFNGHLSYPGGVLTASGTGAAIIRVDTGFVIHSAFQIYVVPTQMIVNGYEITLAGSFYDGIQIDQSTTYNSFGESDIYMIDYDFSGHELWKLQAGGANIDDVYGLYVSPDHTSTYLSGTIQTGPAKFGTVTVPGDFSGSGFLLEMDAPGASVAPESGPENIAQIFPNPARETVYINHQKPFMAVLYNLQGQEIITQTTPDIFVGSLSPGMYVLKISDGNNVQTTKLIVSPR